MLTRKPALGLKCDGDWVAAHVSWGDLEFAHGWPYGCTSASFRITRQSNQRPRCIRHGVLCEVTWGGYPIWTGFLDQPEWNGREAQIKALGLYKLGEHYHAFTAPGATSDNPTVAITAAQPRGLPWLIGSGIPNSALNTGTTEPLNNIADLMDAWAETNGHRWGVGADRYAYMAADPTTPTYRVPAGVVDLGQSSDGYKSRIALRYLHTGGTYRTAFFPVPSGTLPVVADYTSQEKAWSYVEWPEDATIRGPLSDGAALALAQQVYTLSGGKPGFSNGLVLAYGQLLNRGGRPVHPASVRAGVMARLEGVPNELEGTNHTDIVIGDTAYSHGQKTVGVTPVGITVTSPEQAWIKLNEGI